jgi:hypothetical protein
MKFRNEMQSTPLKGGNMQRWPQERLREKWYESIAKQSPKYSCETNHLVLYIEKMQRMTIGRESMQTCFGGESAWGGAQVLPRGIGDGGGVKKSKCSRNIKHEVRGGEQNRGGGRRLKVNWYYGQ